MATLLTHEIERLKKDLLALSALVEERLYAAARAVEARDRELAQQVIDGDDDIDRAEVELEEACLKVLALHQPVAGDLRFVVMALKIDNDLERVGDMAVNIAKRARHLAKRPAITAPLDIHAMTDKVWRQLKKSLDAFVRSDPSAAREVLREDESTDDLYKSGRRVLIATMREHPESVDALVDYLWVLRSCERIGDHATNIAEDVIYLVEGAIARHKKLAAEPPEIGAGESPPETQTSPRQAHEKTPDPGCG